MKLSVIVPVYNLEAYIGPCLSSLLAQNCEFSYEILVADDHSQDASAAIIQSYCDRFPGLVKALYQPSNVGLVANLKSLLRLAQGQYIAYLDGDDLALPGKLETQVTYLDNNPGCAICYHESEVFNSEDGEISGMYSRDFYNHKYIPRKANITHLVKYGTFLQASAMMVRNYEGIENSVDPKCKIIVDYPFHIYNAHKLQGSIDFVDQVLGRYRIHTDSFGAQTARSVSRRIQVLNELLYCCEVARSFGVSTLACDYGHQHFIFAAAMYFLGLGEQDQFSILIEKSSDGQSFCNEKHRRVWLNRFRVNYLKQELSVA